MNYIWVLGRSGGQSFSAVSRKNSLATIADSMVLTPYQNVAGVRYIDFNIKYKITFAEIFIRDKLN
jgi:hypothetical protein